MSNDYMDLVMQLNIIQNELLDDCRLTEPRQYLVQEDSFGSS